MHLCYVPERWVSFWCICSLANIIFERCHNVRHRQFVRGGVRWYDVVCAFAWFWDAKHSKILIQLPDEYRALFVLIMMMVSL
jgi:hypothetical protein